MEGGQACRIEGILRLDGHHQVLAGERGLAVLLHQPAHRAVLGDEALHVRVHAQPAANQPKKAVAAIVSTITRKE